LNRDHLNHIEVKLFAGAREQLGRDSAFVAMTLPATIRQLKQALDAQFPELNLFVRYGRIAVNHDFADDQMTISILTATSDDTPSGSMNSSTFEFALIPPVSGG
jgi:molybdopterin converting factor small subunit